MNFNLPFGLSLAMFLSGIIAGTYFAVNGFRNRRKDRLELYAGLGIFCLYWFEIPFILANAHVRLVLSDFKLFYSLAFPLYFFGMIFIFLGFASLFPHYVARRFRPLLGLWLAACLVEFGFYFLILKGVMTDRTPLFLANFLFFIPLRLLIFGLIVKWIRAIRGEQYKTGIVGASFIIVWTFIALANHAMVINQQLHYPPELWFISLVDYRPLYYTGIFGLSLLVVGILLIVRSRKNKA